MWIKYILHEKYVDFMFCSDINYGDIMFCDWNFGNYVFYFGSSALSTGIIVDTIYSALVNENNS